MRGKSWKNGHLNPNGLGLMSLSLLYGNNGRTEARWEFSRKQKQVLLIFGWHVSLNGHFLRKINRLWNDLNDPDFRIRKISPFFREFGSRSNWCFSFQQEKNPPSTKNQSACRRRCFHNVKGAETFETSSRGKSKGSSRQGGTYVEGDKITAFGHLAPPKKVSCWRGEISIRQKKPGDLWRWQLFLPTDWCIKYILKPTGSLLRFLGTIRIFTLAISNY